MSKNQNGKKTVSGQKYEGLLNVFFFGKKGKYTF